MKDDRKGWSGEHVWCRRSIAPDVRKTIGTQYCHPLGTIVARKGHKIMAVTGEDNIQPSFHQVPMFNLYGATSHVLKETSSLYGVLAVMFSPLHAYENIEKEAAGMADRDEHMYMIGLYDGIQRYLDRVRSVAVDYYTVRKDMGAHR